MNHRVRSPRPPRRTRAGPYLPKNGVRYVIGVGLALGQVFQGGWREHQGPTQSLHTIMVYKIRSRSIRSIRSLRLPNKADNAPGGVLNRRPSASSR